MQSIIPFFLLEKTRLVAKNHCSIEQYQEVVDPIIFPENKNDFLQAQIVSGGLMYNLSRLKDSNFFDINSQHVRSAMVFGNTIYTTKPEICMSYETYAHEVAHVWQMSYAPETFFGTHTLLNNFKTIYAQINNPQDLYNYGGVDSLLDAQEKSLTLASFNPEQQANIVMDYYKLIASHNNTSQPINSEHPNISVYEYFMNDIWSTI